MRSDRAPGVLLDLAALVVIVAGLKAAASVVTLILVAVFLAIVCAPAVLWLGRKGVPSVVAALLVVVSLLGILSGAGVLLGASVNGFVHQVPVYRALLDQHMAAVVSWLSAHGWEGYGGNWLQSFEPGSVMSAVGSVFTAVGGVLGNSLVIILIVTFILLEISEMPNKARAAFPGSAPALLRFSLIAGNVERYVGLKTAVSLVTGLAVTLLLAILGVDFPWLWGLLAFLLNYIPTFGSIVASVPPALLALVQHGYGVALIVVAGYLLVNFVLGSVVEPKLMGRSMGLSTLVVFLSLLAWGWVLGTVGMFLAVPLTMALKIVFECNPETHWIAILMGAEADLPPAGVRSE